MNALFRGPSPVMVLRLPPAVLLAWATPAAARAGASLVGPVPDDETGDPVVNAVILLKGTAPLRTDSAGRFTLAITAGSNEIEGLQDLAITALARRPRGRYVEFERRRASGGGTHFRWNEIHARRFSRLSDALRTARGVRIHYDQQAFTCAAVVSRTPTCQPVWWVDGVETWVPPEHTPIRDIYGIEVYRDPGELPAALFSSRSACMAIVLWIRSRPFRVP